ncbi:MAG TPA: universal stress protein, partial [Acidimicrobiia bacterium]|nr:universal stress protein [Acidimicrobiia bacterium]
ILLPTRGGLNSVYAARLVAAVFPEAEVTVFTVDVPQGRGLSRIFRRSTNATDPSDVVEALGDTPSRVVNKTNSDPAAAILAESRLGYDLLVVGASREEERISLLANVVEQVLRETGIQTLVAQFPNEGSVPTDLPGRVMVPVTATRSSRAAEEFGYSVARVAGGEAVALHVVNRPDGEGLFMPDEGVESAIDAARDLLRGSAEFGERLGVDLTTEVEVGPNAEQEILDYAHAAGMELVVLGASSRPGTNRPFFGHRISYMVERSDIPIVIVALPSPRGTV